MKPRFTVIAGSIVLTCALAAGHGGPTQEAPRRAQQSEQSSALSENEDSPAKQKDDDTFRPRLPNYYGQIGITQQQRKVIYTIQRQYHKRIRELERRLEAVKGERDVKIYNVLTPLQKKLLQQRKEAARLRREARRKARQASDDEP